MLYVNPLEANPLMRGDMAANPSFREKQALQEFERVFLYEFLQEMHKGVPKNSLFGQSREQEFFEEMLDDFLAGQMAASGQLGIARQIQEQLHAAEDQYQHASPEKQDGGLPLDKAGHTGIPLRAKSEGIALERRQQGISLRRGADAGIPLRPDRQQKTGSTGPPASSDARTMPIKTTAGSGAAMPLAPARSIL